MCGVRSNSRWRGRLQLPHGEIQSPVPAARGRLLRPLVRFREMRHPTFDPVIHESITTSDDYFRYATMGLALHRVLTENIPGALAEVGVWRGETSVFRHRLDRKSTRLNSSPAN